jgi:hypothetical protein
MNKKCENCGEEFNAAHNVQKYCSPKCYQLSQVVEKKEYEPHMKVLDRLDVELITSFDRVKIIPIGDIHVGAPEGQCDWGKVERELKYIMDTPDTYMIGMGDYCDCASKMVRKGPNVFTSSLSPMEQYEKILDAFEPLAENGKLLGMLTGNHEQWINEDSGIDIIALLCRGLKVPYLGSACDITINVNKQKYLGYIQHGSSSAKLSNTKIGSMLNSTKDIFAHFFLYGHVHQVASTKCSKMFDGKEMKSYYILTGHFLSWKGGYAQQFGLSACPTGVAKLSLFSDRHDIHVSL